MTRHVMEALGKARIVIEDGRVIEIGEPVVRYCPLFDKHRGIKEFNESTIRENMEYRIGKFGMCTENREHRMRDFLSFGISEIMSLAVKNGQLDAVVLAADGCGTVVLDDPEVIQGLGGRISGLVETEPIPELIEKIGRERLLDPDTAAMDAFGGVHKAFAMRYGKEGVTLVSSKEAAEIRDAFGESVIIFAVHTTGVTEEEANELFDFCDVITACASLPIRQIAGRRALLQAGTKVPVYAATEAGADIMMAKLRELGKEPANVLEIDPDPLI